MSRIALFGAKGFVGSELHKALLQNGEDVLPVTRDNFDASLNSHEFDCVINAAMPAGRFKAQNDPLWDFRETVEKTAKILYQTRFKKFVQISSVSARCQLDTIYGRHKLAAESLVCGVPHLIVRLGPMFGPTLAKGVLMDMLKGNRVFVGGASRYAFAPLSFVADWISRNLDRQGVVEVGARNSMSLADLARRLNLPVEFQGREDHQEMQIIEPGYPDVELVLEYMNKMKKEL